MTWESRERRAICDSKELIRLVRLRDGGDPDTSEFI
jgi:hypothetical protein